MSTQKKPAPPSRAKTRKAVADPDLMRPAAEAPSVFATTQTGRFSSSHPNPQGSLANTDAEPAVDAANDAAERAKAKRLMEECGAVKVTWTWFRTGIKVDKDSKAAMATAAGTTDRGFSANKRLMDSTHPTIKEANALRGRIAGYIRGISLPVTKLGEASGSGKKEGGVYLVRKDDLADFEQRMAAFQSELSTMEQTVNDDMGSIKTADRERLGSLFRNEDYPAAVQLRMSYYAVNLEPPAYLEKFAPKLFEKERRKAEAWWEDVYTSAAASFMEEFKAVVGSWVDSLGPVTKIYPDESHPLARLHEAEVRNKIDRRADPTLPEGRFNVVVRYKVGSGKERRYQEETLGPLTEAEYADLKPHEQVDKHRTFKNSTIENLLGMVGKFRLLANTISASPDFEKMVNEMDVQLKRMGEKPAEIGDELRKSKVVRGQTHALMQELSAKLGREIQTFERKRRRVSTGIIPTEALADDEE